MPQIPQGKVKLALIGKDITHSKSQFMYEKILGARVDYTLLDFASENDLPSLETLFSVYQGVSITTPYKRSYLDRLEVPSSLKNLGAINCLRKKDGMFQGENTDYLAITEILTKKSNKYQGLKVIILGDGVMSKVVSEICLKLDLSFEIYSRKKNPDFFTRAFMEDDTERLTLLINCCGRGYFFKNKVEGNIHFWDLNYNYPNHHYLREKLQVFEDGLELLERQAFFALRFWSII